MRHAVASQKALLPRGIDIGLGVTCRGSHYLLIEIHKMAVVRCGTTLDAMRGMTHRTRCPIVHDMVLVLSKYGIRPAPIRLSLLSKSWHLSQSAYGLLTPGMYAMPAKLAPGAGPEVRSPHIGAPAHGSISSRAAHSEPCPLKPAQRHCCGNRCNRYTRLVTRDRPVGLPFRSSMFVRRLGEIPGLAGWDTLCRATDELSVKPDIVRIS